jgi:hypothetical protein
MILILCFALLLSLAVLAVAEAAGGQYAASLLASFGTTTPENALLAPDTQYALLSGDSQCPFGGVLAGMGKRVCGPLFVYGLAGGVGEVAVFTQADPMSTTPMSNPVATGQLGAYDATRGRYPVDLFVYVNGSQTTKRYTGSFQSLAVIGDSLSFDAVGATVCQNGQGQNQNGQGQNGQGEWWNQNWQGQDEP